MSDAFFGKALDLFGEHTLGGEIAQEFQTDIKMLNKHTKGHVGGDVVGCLLMDIFCDAVVALRKVDGYITAPPVAAANRRLISLKKGVRRRDLSLG